MAGVEPTVKVTGTATVRPAPEIVTVPLYVPAASGATLAVTAIVAGVVPLDGVTDSHEPPEATAVNDAFGEAETPRLCAPGELPPTVAENDNELGLTEKLWVAELTVNVTGTDDVPALLLMLIVPRYVPATSFAELTETVSVCGVLIVPLGEIESQVTPPLDPFALTEMRTALDALTETVCC